ncbi:MAG: hypothetical protein CL878_03910 [Dehalococcoidia bacterium]|nr:hypothetical protein [Dehalococcoidia bacterium]
MAEATTQAGEIQATAAVQAAQATALAQPAPTSTPQAQEAAPTQPTAAPSEPQLVPTAVPRSDTPVPVAIVEGSSEDADTWTYAPATVTVPVGTTILWTNRGQDSHTATSADEQTFNSGLLDQQQSFQFTFNTPGEFPYLCAIHPWMQGTVLVVAAE